jgi:predicted  nucleic acid-binding Zn-ribbon protein
MNNVIDQLYALQQLELQKRGKASESQEKSAELRATVPAPVLAHYDRLMDRGKKGVAVVRNNVCMECHMHVPIGVVATLMRGEDIQLCGNCGRYLCLLPEPGVAPPAEPARVSKPAARKRKPKVPQHAE